MNRFPLLAVALLAGLGLAARAQGPKLRFLAERAPGGLAEVEMLADTTRSAPFKLPTNNLSIPQDAPARAFALVPAGKQTAIASVALPDEGDAFIVLLIPAAKGYEPVVLTDGDPKFKAGDVYFYNRADKKVLGVVGSSRFTLEPGKGTVLRPEGARAEGFYDVAFGVAEEEGNRTLSTTRWPVEEQIRSYVFFFVNPNTRRTDFRAVDEFVPPGS